MAFLAVHHRLSPVPSSLVFIGCTRFEGKERSTGDEQ
jgi:hypothetical protein